MNSVIILGNITRDIELRQTPGGTAVADLGIAMNEKYKNASGEYVEKAIFVDVVAWGRKAEVIAEYFSKGSKILITGELQFDQWENKEGEKRSKLRVKLRDFDFVDSKGSGQGSSVPSQAYSEKSDPAAGAEAPNDFGDDDDIPF